MISDRLTIADDSASCYIHLPFCDRICPYCDFAVLEYDRGKANRYLAALAQEIRSSPAPAHQVRTVYLGGGTPSALEAGDISDVLALVFAKFQIVAGTVECTLEANPSRNAADLPSWRAAGVTRLSVGVQSFDDAELHRLGRTHSAADALEFVREAQTAGFGNISLDLIAGVPGQTLSTFCRSLECALAAAPQHISVYALTIEPGTPYATWYARDAAAFPDDELAAELLDRAHRVLKAAGYRHYELSNFALPGYECAHNIGYWRQRDCVAFGMSASGYEGGVRYKNARFFQAYCASIESGLSPRRDVEHLDLAGRVGEAAMLALRTAEGIDDRDFRDRFGIEPLSAFAAARKKCSAAGLLETDERGVRLTDRGRLLANEVCAEFLCPAL